MSKKRQNLSIDIFHLLAETAEKEKKRRKEELLAPLGVEEFFSDGRITIDRRTCQGVECKLCIDICPTKALFWKAGEVGITPELCVFCGACVLVCIVDDCIRVSRKRAMGEVESFARPRDFIMLQHSINTKKRLERTRSLFPTLEDYIERFLFTP